ncbi:hypothetical protein, partial [Bacillus sp. 220_BSPC]|uniref:hypothetical protein n=1 Tax=Bacillus sp. 220_BSPC TaxID=1579346 RepID=UPI001D042922
VSSLRKAILIKESRPIAEYNNCLSFILSFLNNKIVKVDKQIVKEIPYLFYTVKNKRFGF